MYVGVRSYVGKYIYMVWDGQGSTSRTLLILLEASLYFLGCFVDLGKGLALLHSCNHFPESRRCVVLGVFFCSKLLSLC